MNATFASSQSVPEPATLFLVGSGAGVLALLKVVDKVLTTQV
jgi:hypothetical protein